MIKKSRSQRKTLLIVGEGDTEAAFLRYLRSIYCNGNQGASVTVDNAHGKSPKNIVDTAIRHNGSFAYDKKVCLLDTDVSWPLAVTGKAKAKKISMLGASPCIEGLFLDVLGFPIPESPDECKSQIANMFNFDLTEANNFQRVFDKSKLELARQRVRILNELLLFYEAKY